MGFSRPVASGRLQAAQGDRMNRILLIIFLSLVCLVVAWGDAYIKDGKKVEAGWRQGRWAVS